MPFPMALARFNRLVTNRITMPFAGRAPTFGIIDHRGRKSGRPYRTPISAFPRPGGYAVALTYGPDVQWVQNVLASGEAVLETRGRRHRVTNPRLLRDRSRRLASQPNRTILKLIDADMFLLLDEREEAGTLSPPLQSARRSA